MNGRMSDEPGQRTDEGTGEPETLEDAREQLHALKKELSAVRKESARRRHLLKERDGQEADVGVWRTVALEAVVQAEAAAAGARRPELLGRLVDVGAIEGESLDEIRATVREQIGETLEANPELRAEPEHVGVLSPGARGERSRRKADPNAWLRAARRGG
jgi:hypothetical protein